MIVRLPGGLVAGLLARDFGSQTPVDEGSGRPAGEEDYRPCDQGGPEP